MAKLTRGGGGSRPQKRQYRRFSLHYPVNVKFDLGTSVTELRAFSNNISLGGVLLQSDSAIPQHCDVSFVVTVRGHQIVGPIQIAGEGEVVRVEPHSSGTGFAIAVKCKHPISELQGYLPASPAKANRERQTLQVATCSLSRFLFMRSLVKALPCSAPNGFGFKLSVG